jgi:putative phosphotransacetylase
MKKMIPVGVSNRHIHLSSEHLRQLFGDGYELNILKPLSQPGQFAAEETVTLSGPKAEISRVRILGPVRKQTQIEISRTDAYKLGIDPPVRDSGDLEGTPGLKVLGPKGEVVLERGVIIAGRHIHFHPDEAEEFGVKDGQKVSIRTFGERAVIFENVLVRVHPAYALDCHLDTDEANAAGLQNGDHVQLIDE